eukprot:1918169-Prymnesium_polylepis.1
MESVTFAPEINARSRSLAEACTKHKGVDVVERTARWAEERAAGRRAAQEEGARREAEELRQPQLSRGTLQMVARMGRRER